jgi:hypothetical protein
MISYPSDCTDMGGELHDQEQSPVSSAKISTVVAEDSRLLTQYLQTNAGLYLNLTVCYSLKLSILLLNTI